ncbi:MAG: hypothetical protein ABSH47_24785 [Bryobacteraceae bacterium]|jgi:hypothetical protein
MKQHGGGNGGRWTPGKTKSGFPTAPTALGNTRFGLSGSGGNLTHHFNPVAVHSNIADPSYGIFFGENRHLLRADCEVIF